MPDNHNERAAVLAALISLEEKHISSTDALAALTAEHPFFDDREKAFATRLFKGCVERREELDQTAGRFIRKEPRRNRSLIRNILRIGVYQLLFMDSVPDRAACSETVELTRIFRIPENAGFINAVLRSVIRARDKEAVNGSKGSAPAAGDPSMPAWIMKMWAGMYGSEEAARLCAKLLEPRPVTVRLSPCMTGEEKQELMRRIMAAGAEAVPARWMPDAFHLMKTGDLRLLPGYAEGLFTVQDEASMMPAVAAGLQKGDAVLDVCAAPGGKALHAAQILQSLGAGTVAAYDLTEKKAERIRVNAARLRCGGFLTAGIRDASVPAAGETRKFDVLFCDLPCSGLGVIGRKPDIKYRVQPEDIRTLAALQRKILSCSVPLLKDGGKLIYSTCTITREENDGNADYIEKELGLTPDPMAGDLPAGLFRDGTEGNGAERLQLLPHIHGTDGFFLARFRKG